MAIARLMEIDTLVLANDYKSVETFSHETGHSLVSFVTGINFLTDYSKWTDKMLEERLDKPFYRQSLFDNYQIRG